MPRGYICSECHASFTRSADLDRHMGTHGLGKPDQRKRTHGEMDGEVEGSGKA